MGVVSRWRRKASWTARMVTLAAAAMSAALMSWSALTSMKEIALPKVAVLASRRSVLVGSVRVVLGKLARVVAAKSLPADAVIRGWCLATGLASTSSRR